MFMDDYEKMVDKIIQKKRRKAVKVLMVLNIIVTILGFYNLTRGDLFFDVLGFFMILSGLCGIFCNIESLKEKNNE